MTVAPPCGQRSTLEIVPGPPSRPSAPCKSLELIGQIKPPGAMGGGHLISTDPKGNVYVAASSVDLTGPMKPASAVESPVVNVTGAEALTVHFRKSFAVLTTFTGIANEWNPSESL
jgi:hypothetical protein